MIFLPPIHRLDRRRFAFTLSELLVSLGLLTVLMMLAGRVLRTLVLSGHANIEASNQETQIDSAVREIRKDAWNSRSVAAPGPRRVDLVEADGAGVHWSVDDNGAVTRKSDDGSLRSWPGVARDWNFAVHQGRLTIADAGGMFPEPLILVSQLSKAPADGQPEAHP